MGVILGEIPSNFLFRSRCPQVEILNGLADVFISHGGANSMMESILAEVPVLVLPHLGDQFQNGAICEREGVGFAVDDPVADCSEELLQNLLHKIGSRMAEHKTNLRRLKSSLTSAKLRAKRGLREQLSAIGLGLCPTAYSLRL